MSPQRPAVRLYRNLIRLYPRRFREQLGESMERTFLDLYDERRTANASSFAFLVVMFYETVISIVDQHLLEARDKLLMKRNIIVAAMVGFAALLPFALLEYVNTGGFKTYGAPVALFVMLWFLVFAFAMLLTPTIRDVRSGASVMAHPAGFVLRAVLMIAVAAIWILIVRDQMPCFMGIPNCD